MARPFKRRLVAHEPGATYFKQRGIPMTELAEIVLGFDELEAVRLADLDGLYQEDAAEKMKVSRQTFGNIIHAAHAKIAEAIVNGKALKIDGGMCTMKEMRGDRAGMPSWGQRRSWFEVERVLARRLPVLRKRKTRRT
jgi:predicted DNA-binding protein (UPF0251 family)